ncbi:MAG: 3,4-dihydroxyphenylacetate 2,3-dioxygenase [Alphaproteobacteria bacterium]|nr:MAG: 3,4-dihydroxyphenylacetate 2,3-dioxygenase [Alphaproteobacteria bacterium]
MPLSKISPASPPPFQILHLGYVERFTTNLERARDFYVEHFGLQISAEDERHLYLRAMQERRHHSLLVSQGSGGEVGAIGFRLAAEEDLDRAMEWFSRRGLRGAWIERPWTGRRVLRVVDPWGVPLEFYSLITAMPPLHHRYRLYHGARPLRLDRIALRHPDVEEAMAFYAAIGFAPAEIVREEPAARLRAVLADLPGAPAVLTLLQGSGPGLHHLAYRVSDPAHVIDFLDLLSSTGHASMIEHGPGRHGLSNAFYLYILDADRHRTGLCCGDSRAAQAEGAPIEWAGQDPRWQRLWGAPPPASWEETAAPFAAIPRPPRGLKRD